jgi:hypothetical protein
VGLACVSLGAGRLQATDAIDFGAGVLWHKKVGDSVLEGELLAHVYAQDAHGLDACLERLQGSIECGPDGAPASRCSNEDHSYLASLVTHKVTSNGIESYQIPPRLIDFAVSWCGVPS